MKESKHYQKDIESIRMLMERSTKFISLSGLSGILSGLYALIGAAFAYFILQFPLSSTDYEDYNLKSVHDTSIILKLMLIAGLVLMASLSTGYWFTLKKSKKLGVKINDANTLRLLINLAIPLVSGGLFILIFLSKGNYGIIAPACLIFYGLALINASPNLYEEIRYLGYSEIALGLVCAYFSGYGLLFWAMGFGVLHVIYGGVMYKKYGA